MKLTAAFLDYATLDQNDINFQPLYDCFDTVELYAHTTVDEIIPRLQNVDVAIVNKVILDENIIAQLPQLKLILISATGTNNIDLHAASQRQIVVCNCQGYGTASVAQHTMALMLALATNVLQYHHAVQSGRWQQSEQFCFLDYPIIELSGKTLGILGYGELGQAVATLAKAFGMRVIIGQIPNRPIHSEYVNFDQFLSQVDILSLHCPLSAETKNLIDANALAKMKSSALLINCARGGIVNEQDLADALKQKVIAGAAMDVLSVEPPKTGNILLENHIPNLILTPHSAWGSVQARQRIIQQVAENAVAFKQKQPLRQVNI